MKKVLYTVVALFLVFVGVVLYEAGRYQERSTTPACSAPTEDSVILDCDYRNGAWYRR